MELVSDSQSPNTEKRTLKDRQRLLLNNEFASDVTLSLQNDDRIFAHKVILATTSPVFASIFYGPLASKEDNLEIPDCDDKICFLEFLKHFYCDECELDWENIFVILYLANQYLVSSLSSKCVEFLTMELNAENVLAVLQHANRFGEEKLIQNCLQFIYPRASVIFKSEAFVQLELDTLALLLTQDKLNIREIELFNAVNTWCEHQLQESQNHYSTQDKRDKRKTLGDAVKLIRFPTLDAKDFRELCVPSGILTPEECSDIFCFLTMVEHSPSANREEVAKKFVSCHNFSLIERSGSQRILSRDVTVEILSNVSHGSVSRNGIRFEVDKPIKLLGVTILGDSSKNKILDFYIKVRDESSDKLIAHPHVSVMTNPSKDMYATSCPQYTSPPNSFKVLFQNAVSIDAGRQYSVHAKISGPLSCKGLYEKMLHVSEDGITFKFYKIAYHYNGTSQGQFPEFLYQQL